MKCKSCPAYGYDHISYLCVLRYPITKGYCNRTDTAIHNRLEEFLATDSRALHGHYTLPNYKD